MEVKDGANLEDEEEAAGGCTLTRLIFPDLATTVVSLVKHQNHRMFTSGSHSTIQSSFHTNTNITSIDTIEVDITPPLIR